jgi:CBS domain-containing protein
MLKRPIVHDVSTTVGELRAFFRDDHVHMALLVDGGKLVAAVEPADLESHRDETPARLLVHPGARTIDSHTAAAEAEETMRRSRRRRLAVVGDDGTLLGLLCLKASRTGFCSDDDVGQRRRSGLTAP